MMSKLEDELYKNHKEAVITMLIAGGLISIVWIYGDKIWPFPTTIVIKQLWLLQIIATGIIIIVALGSFILSLLKQIKKLKKLKPISFTEVHVNTDFMNDHK